MFTGIVEELGTVASRTPAAAGGARFRFACTTVLDDVVEGASIAVNGVCLTVVAWDDATPATWWEADAVEETLRRSTLGGLEAGDPVNLERPVRLADRLGGHLVQGHVDGVGTVVDPAPDLRVQVPDGLARYIVEKGSITVDGVSLTVVDSYRSAEGHDAFTVAVIPHTAAVTTLGHRRPGDGVNLEVDVTAKYVERLLTWKAG
jgi:riboflavin synthase